MHRKQVLALGGALVAAVAITAVDAAAAGATKVSVRVEGASRTLLTATTVQTHSGSITKGGVASGKCSAQSGMGALDAATHHNWVGTFSTSLKDYFIKGILGETDNGPKLYWGIYVNNKSASTGACGVKLHAGDQLLFAAAPYPSYPLALSAPAHASAGRAFTVTVKGFDAKGRSKALANATVAGHTTDSHGHATITLAHTTTLTATAKGYVRAEALVRVS
jgi:Domain of unknown function (DUF4430)